MSTSENQEPPLHPGEGSSPTEGASLNEVPSLRAESSSEETSLKEARNPSLLEATISEEGQPREDPTFPGEPTSPREGKSLTEPTSPRDATSPREGKSLTEPTSPGDVTSPRDVMSPRDATSPREGKSPTEPTSPGDVMSPRDVTSPRDATSPREGKSPTEPTSPGDVMSPRDATSPREGKSPTEPTSPGDVMSPRDATSPREGKSPTEPTSPGDVMSPRDATSPREGKSPTEPTSLGHATSPGKETPREGISPEETKSPELNTSDNQLINLDQQKEVAFPQRPVQVSPPALPLPTASPEAINFLASITLEDLALTYFIDSLVTISDTGKELGEFTISIHPTFYKGAQCVNVTANSHGAIDNIPCGTSISAHVSNNLETMELHHHEYIKLKDHSLVKETLMKKEQDGYVLTRHVTMGENVKSETSSFSLTDMEGFVSEASNLVLLRIMAQRNNVPDNMVFLSFDTEMQLSTSTYLNLGPRMLTIGKTECEVFSIQRTIHSEASCPMSWQCSFLPDGHLSSRVQVGSPITMRLKQLPQIRETGISLKNLHYTLCQVHPFLDVEEPKPVFEKKPLNWEEDMQLYLKFIDKTEALKADYSSYIRHHPELKCMLADFLQFLLLRKPQDVVTFAAEYFSSFSAFHTEQSPFLTSNKASPFKEP